MIIGGTISTRKRAVLPEPRHDTEERDERHDPLFLNDFVYSLPVAYYMIQPLPLATTTSVDAFYFLSFSLLFFFTIQSIRQCTARVFFIAFEIGRRRRMRAHTYT